jgi:C-terminal processing protease CtpA/Prc
LLILLKKLTRWRNIVLLGLLMAGTATSAIPRFSRASHRAPTPAVEALSKKDRLDAFEDIWETINEKYYDPSFNGVNWRAVRESYRPLIERASSDEDFYVLLKRMVGELHDAHTRFSTPEERRERERFEAVSAGVAIFEVEGKPVIVGVEPDSDASRAGVEEGMLALEIDGKPIADRLADARARVAGSSTDRAIQLRVYRLR